MDVSLFIVFLSFFLRVFRCVGDHRGDRQSFFPTKSARFLSKDELTYITEVVSK